MRFFSPMEYLIIDIANNFGMDKLTYRERLDWFTDNIEPYINNFSSDEDIFKFVESSDNIDELDKPLVFASLQAYRDYLNGKPSGYMVSFDATASGLQIMSALTNDELGMQWTNATDEPKRYDIYTEVFEQTKILYKHYYPNKEPKALTRKDIKAAIMVLFYGGTLAVIKHLDYDKELYNVLVQVCNLLLKKPMYLLNGLLDTINAGQHLYEWIMPDGFHVKTPLFTEYSEKHVFNDEVIYTKYKDLGLDESFKGTPANVMHSIDAMIMREMVRRCNYNKNKILEVISNFERLLQMSENELELLSNTVGHGLNDRLQNYMNQYSSTAWVSARVFDLIESQSDYLGLIFKYGETGFYNNLYHLAEAMMGYKPFDLLVIHDCYKCHPNNVSYVRYWYAQIMQELIESDCLLHIIKQLPNNQTLLDAFDKGIIGYEQSDIIPVNLMKSNYMLC